MFFGIVSIRENLGDAMNSIVLIALIAWVIISMTTWLITTTLIHTDETPFGKYLRRWFDGFDGYMVLTIFVLGWPAVFYQHLGWRRLEKCRIAMLPTEPEEPAPDGLN